MPISGLYGTNIKDPVEQKVAPWYKGGTLFSVRSSVRPQSGFADVPTASGQAWQQEHMQLLEIVVQCLATPVAGDVERATGPNENVCRTRMPLH